ncbi:MAG TPA: right-handed parallel beta-helix repeat-containing protein [Phycisphaerales bacterium]|nr:right-handed parallel beta-helix repeat-containing protein [Phycisphaerales bacterium]
MTRRLIAVRMILLGVCATAMPGLARDALAETYYVRKSGSDSANGLTPATAWASITKAATSMIAGDTVYVGAGTYQTEVVPASSGTSTNPIRYIADTTGQNTGDAGAVTISTWGSSHGFELKNRDYVEISGFSLRISGQFAILISSSIGCKIVGCDASGSSKPGFDIVGSEVEIDGCVVKNLGAAGIEIGPKGGVQSKVTIRNVSITGVSAECVKIKSDSTVVIEDSTFYNYPTIGVMVGGRAQATVSRCTFYGGSTGVQASGDSVAVDNCLFYNMGGEALKVPNGSGAKHQATFINCTVSSVSRGVFNDAGTCYVINSIFNNCGGGGIVGSGKATYDYHNLFNNNQPSGKITESVGRVTGDPKFKSWNDFHTQDGSPARDSGTQVDALITLDKLKRPANGAFDIGCYEYGATSSEAQPRVFRWTQVAPQ